MASLCRELRAQFPKDSFRACVDTAPVLEREFAQRAGLGAVGKNTLLIQRGVGSWLLLGEIITSLPLAASRESDPDPCGTCTRCIDACPTKAITPWSVDATRCISYLTIEHRGAIDEEFHEAIGDWIFGCDICQEVCPHNQPTERTQRAAVHPAYEPRHDGFNLLDVLNWDESARQQAFANSAMKRAKLNMIKRNAIIAAGNAKAEEERDELRKRIGEIAADVNEDELVRTTARAVLARFDSIKAADTGTAV
jgi:epoxyqueuosine reductase